MADSRLNKHLQKQAFKNIFLRLAGIIMLGFVLYQFGPQLLINFSLMVAKLKGDTEIQNTNNDLTFVSPPTLNPMPSATSSAKINISGYSLPKQTIKLYVNGDFVDKEATKKDKSFTFNNVELEPGDNDIKTKAITENDKESDYSTTIKITYVDKPPSLDIESPSDGQSFSKDQITISGKTNAGNKITVNDFWAIVNDEGKYSYQLHLQNGENKIKIEATDDAGNKTIKEIRVIYSP